MRIGAGHQHDFACLHREAGSSGLEPLHFQCWNCDFRDVSCLKRRAILDTQFSSDWLFRLNCTWVFPLLWLFRSDGAVAGSWATSKLSAGKVKLLGEKQEETETLLLNVTGWLLLVLLHLWVSNWVKKMGDPKSWGSSELPVREVMWKAVTPLS